MSQPVSFKIVAKHLGGHWHVRFWTSEHGPETTHGTNGELVFRESEWEAFRTSLECSYTSSAVLEITEEPNRG